ncbi:hypothetical protein SRABI26_00389 [Arthrobacter sp. Bi26]|uniref:DUF6603 domain-containing protein n=1 Tax=Arthrobacter sp. Bi26 TaxID=2822350 RepID=UPI001D68FFE3|nr:DUF6603 domain-containing protein [Arthrobacter sp. Bi26]CAH0137466.1 hypothetical protein SRABI26_00389 [Arthrobacter sp. Bi26]
MTLAAEDLGVLGKLGKALGVFNADGNANPGWFGNPQEYLTDILTDENQREALIAFVDEVLGGEERETDADGATWLPVVSMDDPDVDVFVTINATGAAVDVGLGARVTTAGPETHVRASLPLFRLRKSGSPAVSNHLLLGQPGARITVSASVTITPPGTSSAGTALQPSIGAIGLQVSVPTSPADTQPAAFGFTLERLLLPGAATPRDLSFSADGVGELDDAVLDLVLSLVRAQADAAGGVHPLLGAVAGLLGLRPGDNVPDFPITELSTSGVAALAAWVRTIMTTAAARRDWLDDLAQMLQGNRDGDTVRFNLGAAVLTFGIRVDTGPSGNPRLTPTLAVRLGNDDARAEVGADLVIMDLVTGAAVALPALGVWAASGTGTDPVLDVAGPPAVRAETLRVGFQLDADRRVTFVLAADRVTLGEQEYAMLDLSSPDAMMDAAGHAVEDIANDLLNALAPADNLVRMLLGITPPAVAPPVNPTTLPALMADPLAAVADYWQELLANAAGAEAILGALRDAISDATLATVAVEGDGTAEHPWRVGLVGPLQLEVSATGGTASIGLAVMTTVDTLGAGCTVVEARFAATLVEIDFGSRTASLLPGVAAELTAHESDTDPGRVRLSLGDAASLTADKVGLRLNWKPERGLTANLLAPHLTLHVAGTDLPVALPVVTADGSVTLPAQGWEALERLIGYLGDLMGGVIGDLAGLLGWTTNSPQSGGDSGGTGARLPLADLVTDPRAALLAWLPGIAATEMAPALLDFLADLLEGSGPVRGMVRGTGHPDDPYHLPTGAGLPVPAVWFPPQGLEPRQTAASNAIRDWRPGDEALPPIALANALEAEAELDPGIRGLVQDRPTEAGLAALIERWTGTDGRIVPPAAAPAGVTVLTDGVAAGQLLDELVLDDLLDRTPAIAVYVALGAAAWPDAPADRRVDLSAAGLTPEMFATPAAATGEWFVALGSRVDCRAPGSTTDGTPEQVARLRRLVQGLGSASNDIVLVGIAGAGHCARLVAHTESQVATLVTVGTPLSPIALTALSTQPTADALRLLHRLLPAASDPDTTPEDEDEDLALGRALVGSMMELTSLADPSADLRQPVVLQDPPRTGLEVIALFGQVAAEQAGRAVTAIVCSGLAARARVRAVTPLPRPTAIEAGVVLNVPPSGGTLKITAEARLTLVSYDLQSAGPAEALDLTRRLRARLRVSDRTGWLLATPEAELRAVSADVLVPLDGAASGTSTVTLHDARIFGQSWEELILGTGPGAVAVLPEARSLLAVLVQRLTADATSAASMALADLMQALGLIAPTGGLAGDALDQLIRDPGGLIRDRLADAVQDVVDPLNDLLGPAAAGLDLATRTLSLTAGSDLTGRFGWSLQLTASPASTTGRVLFGPATPSLRTGSLQFEVLLAPFRARIHWHQPGGAVHLIQLWPDPDPAAIGRGIAAAAPSLGGHVALELMRRLDPVTQPIIDAALDALGLLTGADGDSERSLRPLAGLIADPAGWLRGPDSLAASPARFQVLFDALRPLMGAAGSPGSSLALASGVSLAVRAAGPAARMELAVDTGAWTAPGGAAARLTAGVTAALTVEASGPATVSLELFLGTGAEAGHRALHLRLGGSGIEVFIRPANGPDISLLPFAGLGALSAVAGAALPFLLDELAGCPAPVGPLVATIGDALALRTGTPGAFDRARLQAWAANPASRLAASAGSIAATGINTLAPLIDAYLPAGVSADAPSADTLRVAVGAVSLMWGPTTGAVTISLDDLAVPGIQNVSGALTVSGAGLEELAVTVGPAAIDTGSVILRPFVTVAAGATPTGGRRIVVGLAADDDRRFGARWLLDGQTFALISSVGSMLLPVESEDSIDVALRLVEVIADVVAAVALATEAVSDVLDTAVGATDVRNLLRGVLLEDTADPDQLIDGLFDVATALSRVQKLAANLGTAGLSITVEGLTITLLNLGGEIGLQLGVSPRWPLLEGAVSLWLETDDSWIIPDPPGSGGIFLGVLGATAPLTFRPSLTVNGVGLRIGSAAGMLVDSVIGIESIALHVYAAVDASGIRGGGAQLQLTNLALAPSGGGQNGIAQGIMRDTGPTPPRPAFSPALAVQKHDNSPVEVTLRAGDGAGPWWIAIRRGFGPLYLEQVGFGVGVADHRIERVSLLMDGSVALFGLSCAVDDLQITYLAGAPNADIFNINSWQIDLAGLAVTADMAGLSIAGGLLKHGIPPNIEYLGMLLARFGVYGITIYGGYGESSDTQGKFVAFFAVGAINGPIGGPPAFFLTGIGGGFGINRQLIVPTDLNRFGDYPLIQALDIAAKPQQPMDHLRSLAAAFPAKRGSFWFAAGISFNSFALVDGIAVLAVQVGDGLDINLLGLARMALPRPQAAIVSIELALVVRFSTSEGVLWVQAQLTDNSWLLYPDVRLTGGFAYVIWFKGEHRGEFVLTMGGYHPDFHRDGYPVVPRLGLHWAIGDYIVIEAGSYFALTSEAVMAGGDFHVSARFGWAWAELRFGAHGIIYFDPFRYQVSAYVRISAGVTIDLWIFGEVTISVSLGARIEVEGPQFHGIATFEVGPVELSVPFGDSEQTRKELLGADTFIEKYLEPTAGGAQAHAVMVSAGTLPAKGEHSTPDGSGGRPFVVVPEFSLTFSSTVPAVEVFRTNAAAASLSTHHPSRSLGVGPMGTPTMTPRITLTWRRAGTAVGFPFAVTARPFGSFPVGVWGPPQPDDNRPVPKAEMIEALNELELTAAASPSGGGPAIPYHQVDVGARKPLPFTRRSAQVNGLKKETRTLANVVSQPATADEAFALARRFLAATATPTGLAALRGERQAPPRLGTLGEGLDADVATEIPVIGARPPGKVYDHFVDAPQAIGLLPGVTVDQRNIPGGRTTVKDADQLWRQNPPTLASAEEARSRSIAARLVVSEPAAVSTGRDGGSTETVIGTDRVPVTAVAHAPSAVVRTAGGTGTDHLDGFTASLTAGRRVGRGTAGATLGSGETVVLKLPNAYADAGDGDRPRLQVSGDPARVVLLGHGGRVMADQVLPDGGTVEIGQGAERIAVIGQGAAEGPGQVPVGLAGWHAGSSLPYAGWSSALAPGCVLRSNGDPLKRNDQRVEAGWVAAAELAKGQSTVTTRFAEQLGSVVFILDDPAALGDPMTGRGLLLGLDGATRATGLDGEELPPLLLVAENRSVLAYDVLPGTEAPAVTIASELGWSLAGVMGWPGSAAEAVAMIGSRGLDAALRPLAGGTIGSSKLTWLGQTRTTRQRLQAKTLASGRPSPGRTSARTPPEGR